VGNFLNNHFISTFKKIPTANFRIVEIRGHLLKQGGNIASYFLTPDGKVISVVGGVADDYTLLKEARWVNEMWNETHPQADDPPVEDRIRSRVQDRVKAIKKEIYTGEGETSHFKELQASGRKLAQVGNGVYIFRETLPSLGSVYQEVFESLGQIVGERKPIDPALQRNGCGEKVEDLPRRK
jgi:hypothetical protein